MGVEKREKGRKGEKMRKEERKNVRKRKKESENYKTRNGVFYKSEAMSTSETGLYTILRCEIYIFL